jgi:amino acid transporter
MVFMFITAAVLAEICSALPLSGSIYIWAAESAGPKYARFFGFLVASWSTTAWMTFTAGNCQVWRPYPSPSVAEKAPFLFLLTRRVLGNGELHRVAACRMGD